MTTARHLIAAITALGIGLLPLAATANPGSGFRKTQKGVMSRHVPALMKGNRAQVVYAQNCPPGLSKKSPPCVPPGQAKKSPIQRNHHESPLQKIYQRSHPHLRQLARLPDQDNKNHQLFGSHRRRWQRKVLAVNP